MRRCGAVAFEDAFEDASETEGTDRGTRRRAGRRFGSVTRIDARVRKDSTRIHDADPSTFIASFIRFIHVHRGRRVVARDARARGWGRANEGGRVEDARIGAMATRFRLAAS